MTLTAPTQFSRILATSHNRNETQSHSKVPFSSQIGSFHKRGIPIQAVVDNREALIPLTSSDVVVAFARVDAADAKDLEQYRWRLFDRSAQGYHSYAVRVTGPRGTKTVPMHRHLLGLEPGSEWHVDHINGDGLDNRRANLRKLTRAQNMQNYRRVQERNATGYRGVGTSGSRFTAHARLNKRTYHFGTFDTALEAAEVACKWRSEHMPFATSCGLPACREGTYIHA